MKIETSLDWDEIRNELKVNIQSVSFNPDLRKMLRNIDGMVTELSKQEVEIRRHKSSSYNNTKLLEINEAINNLEKWITMAMLLE